MQLFSRMDIGERAMRSAISPCHTAKDTMQAVIATPRCQPVFNPMYRLVKASPKPRIAPMITARTVSCCAPSPRYARAYHSSSFISATSAGRIASGRPAAISSGVTAGRWNRPIAPR